jgi:hypothetical protein
LSSDVCNADTETPTAEDEYLATVSDPNLQPDLRWLKYLQCLQDGAWGDHVALQRLCNMLNKTVHPP